jgi:RNA polymerase primary sigma factor
MSLFMNELVESISMIDIVTDIPAYSLRRLKDLESRQGYVTYDDVLQQFPDAAQDVDYLDQIFSAIANAGIIYNEEDSPNDITDQGSTDEAKPAVDARRQVYKEDDPLSKVDPDDLLGLYFCEAARSPLLTFEEEIDLAKRIELSVRARRELSEIKIRSAKRHEELILLVDDGWAAENYLITANSRLVISIAKKYIHRGVPFLDLIQEGNIGLMRAVKRYDYKRGYKFSTYATWWIRQAVTRALADQSRTIRLPVNMNDQVARMFRMQNKLKQELGRDPGVPELAAAIGVDSEKIEQMLKYAQFPLSLDMPDSIDDDSVLGDYIEDQDSPDPDELTTLSLLSQHLEQILELLPAREAQILKLRYGLSNGETHTLQQVGLKIGVSRERIRQIESQAIRRLRQPTIQNKLRSYLSQTQT